MYKKNASFYVSPDTNHREEVIDYFKLVYHRHSSDNNHDNTIKRQTYL